MKPLSTLNRDESQVLELKHCHMCLDVEWDTGLHDRLKEDGIMDKETGAKISVSKEK